MINSDQKKLLYMISAFLGLSIITQIPVWMVRFPPLVDYPNHLARMHIIAHIQESPILQKYYSIDWQIIPNLAMDILVPVMAKFMPTEAAGKAFIGLIFFLLCGGTAVLHYVLHRKISCMPLLAFMFLYNRIFLWGFLNYLFGLALILWILAGWIYCQNKSPLMKTFVFLIPTLCLFFSHLFALGVYALCIIGYEFHRYRNGFMKNPIAEWPAAFAQFVLPSILFLCFSPTSHTSLKIIFGDFYRRIISLIFPLFNYSKGLDIATFFLLAILFSAGLFSKKISVAKQMRYPLLLLFLAGLAMPELIFSSYMADIRVNIAIAFLLISASEFHIEKQTFKFNIFLMAVLLIVFSIRMTVIVNQWQEAHGRYAQYVKAIDKIEEGSRLLLAVTYYPKMWDEFPIPLTHIPCIAVITKSAFVPFLFAFPTQQPLTFRQPYKEIARQTPGCNSILNKDYDSEQIMADYDYLLVSNEQWMKYQVPAKFPEIYRGTNFRLFKLHHQMVK